ncbi:hypothetical protein [Jiangella alkaliphila]|uniref:Uncharacterized protein n=1 Tax=Jiangella alkaliphila TaxID=419479 RepID=A0A1H2IUT1_9ACTN|nr:hypothetical protein [Jiangella alkaliphila]SDU47568.1 hypothetical protein SAMN04488563_2008 [Jiangella alkaliphila]
MATYAVDSKRQRMTATGVVNAVHEWEDTAEGRRQSERQALDEETRMPLWGVEVIYRTVSFGNELSARAQVIVPAPLKPEIAEFSSIEFGDLVASPRATKAGQLVESWRAGGIASHTPPRKDAGKTTSGSGDKAA